MTVVEQLTAHLDQTRLEPTSNSSPSFVSECEIKQDSKVEIATTSPRDVRTAKKPPKPGSKRYQAAKKLNSHPADNGTKPQLIFHDKSHLPNVSFWSGVAILSFLNVRSLEACLLRAHDYYEGRRLRGPLRGVNFPLSTLLEWMQTLEGSINLTPAEAGIIDVLIPTPAVDHSSTITYVVAYIEKDTSTLIHELAHAHYYMEAAYREQCAALYNNLPDRVREYIGKELGLRNYRDDVFIDEFQAYLVEGPAELGKKFAHELVPIHKVLKSACATLHFLSSKNG